MGHLLLILCVFVYMCVCVLPTCVRVCVFAAEFVHKANIYTQWHNKDIKNISYYARHLYRMQACRSCLSLSLPPLSLSHSLILCGTLFFIAHPQAVNFPMPPSTLNPALLVYPVVLHLPIEA